MANADAFDEAARRLSKALDSLDGLLQPHLDDNTVRVLRAEIAALEQERYRLVADLGQEAERARRLAEANDEVSERLDAVIASLRAAGDGES